MSGPARPDWSLGCKEGSDDAFGATPSPRPDCGGSNIDSGYKRSGTSQNDIAIVHHTVPSMYLRSTLT